MRNLSATNRTAFYFSTFPKSTDRKSKYLNSTCRKAQLLLYCCVSCFLVCSITQREQFTALRAMFRSSSVDGVAISLVSIRLQLKTNLSCVSHLLQVPFGMLPSPPTTSHRRFIVIFTFASAWRGKPNLDVYSNKPFCYKALLSMMHGTTFMEAREYETDYWRSKRV